MIKFKPRRIATIFAVFVIAFGSYIGWQIHLGQQLANQYMLDSLKLAQGKSQAIPSIAPPATNSNEVKPRDSSNPSSSSENSQSQASSSITPSSQAPVSQANTPSSPADTPAPENTPAPVAPPSPVNFKQLMSNTYQETIQAMQNVKDNTLALQGKKISIATYKASILQAQATFSSAQAFVRANPPTEAKLTPSYQEFLAGISLAKDSMSVVLNGISSLSPSSLYAAREMGGNALQQVNNSYANF